MSACLFVPPHSVGLLVIVVPIPVDCPIDGGAEGVATDGDDALSSANIDTLVTESTLTLGLPTAVAAGTWVPISARRMMSAARSPFTGLTSGPDAPLKSKRFTGSDDSGDAMRSAGCLVSDVGTLSLSAVEVDVCWMQTLFAESMPSSSVGLPCAVVHSGGDPKSLDTLCLLGPAPVISLAAGSPIMRPARASAECIFIPDAGGSNSFDADSEGGMELTHEEGWADAAAAAAAVASNGLSRAKSRSRLLGLST